MSDNAFDNAQNIINILKKHFAKLIVGLLVIIGGWSTVFTINPEEVGVVTRFGELNRTVQPGMNFKIPVIEDVSKVKVQRQLKQEFGFRTEEVGVRTEYAKEGAEKEESLMLTGDLNLADVEWVVQYRISDPYLYLFRVRNAEKTLRDMSEAMMRSVVGDRTVNEVLTVGRQDVASTVEGRMQELCDNYELGIDIDQVVLQDVNPPEPVKAAFNEVNEAQQERETLINQARSEYNRVIPRAEGRAQETIQRAEGYAVNRVNRAEGEADRFTAVYEEFVQAPEVTRKRLYLETMEEVIPKLSDKIITDQNNSQRVLPIFPMQQQQGILNRQNNE